MYDTVGHRHYQWSERARARNMSEPTVARVLHDHSARIDSLDFSMDGESLLSTGDDQRVCLYSCQQGTLQRVVRCRGATGLGRFTHDPLSVIVAARCDTPAIRYLSLHDNRYLRDFTGHTKEIVSLQMSPTRLPLI